MRIRTSEGRGFKAQSNTLSPIMALLIMTLLGTTLAAQKTASLGAAQGGTVNLGDFNTARPGKVINVPVVLSASDENARPASLAGEISFPKGALAFSKARQGLSGELSEVQIEAKVKDDAGDPGRSVLEFTISGKKPVEPGILAYLLWNVSEDAPKGKATLVLKSLNATSGKGEPLQIEKGRNGQITILGKDDPLTEEEQYRLEYP